MTETVCPRQAGPAAGAPASKEPRGNGLRAPAGIDTPMSILHPRTHVAGVRGTVRFPGLRRIPVCTTTLLAQPLPRWKAFGHPTQPPQPAHRMEVRSSQFIGKEDEDGNTPMPASTSLDRTLTPPSMRSPSSSISQHAWGQNVTRVGRTQGRPSKWASSAPSGSQFVGESSRKLRLIGTLLLDHRLNNAAVVRRAKHSAVDVVRPYGRPFTKCRLSPVDGSNDVAFFQQ